ncbi:protein unc-79 homolog [Photinus pyralis]|uniref:protein unc-79 homolog n=1 Tax=Photinus pyralis TaxID=7054 RepID=UPI00126717CA|nr:protein unc-79 homolog [Photinus pyralis]
MLKIPARFKQCDLSVSLAFDYCDCIVNMGTRSAAFTVKIRSLYDYHLRLMHGIMPPPSGVDIANTIKYFSQTLLTVLRDVPNSPLELLKNPKMDSVRMGLYPSLDYKGLYNSLIPLIEVAPLMQYGLHAFGEAVLQCLGCLLPFLEHDFIDNLPYLTASTIAVLPSSLHQDIVNSLCFYILPFTITRNSDREHEVSQSVSAVIMMIFQYSSNPAHHCQLLECLMTLKQSILKDILSVIAYGTSTARSSAAKLLFYYWPAFNANLFDRKGLICKLGGDSAPFVCQREMCPNAGNAEAAKVCYNHCISITFASDKPPPLYLCIECANEIHREHPNQSFFDILHPMQQVSMVCENKNCRSTDRSAVSMCFSSECASYNGNRPIRYCLQCHNNRHNNKRGGDHIVHKSIPPTWSMDKQMQTYMIEAIISLLKESKIPTHETKENSEVKTIVPAVDNISIEERQLLGRYGVWLLVGRCTPTESTPIDVMGRILAMLFHWFHITAYTYDGQEESTLEKLKTENVCGWLKDLSKSHYKLFISCLLPHPPEYARVGGHWDTLASRTSHLKDGLNRLFCLIPYEVITQEIWDYIMPHWMEAIVNDVPEKELAELKIILSKILDVDMSPLGFNAYEMYHFLAVRFEKTTAKVQEQALHWLQTLTMLELIIPLHLLFSIFGNGVNVMKNGVQLTEDDKPVKFHKSETTDDPRCSSISPVVEDCDSGNTSLSDDEGRLSQHTEFESDAEHNLFCCIIMLDILLKQMELQGIEKHTGLNYNLCKDVCKLLKCMVTTTWIGSHVCTTKSECGYCESSIMWHQLCLQLVIYLSPQYPAYPPDPPLEDNGEDRNSRKSPPENDKKETKSEMTMSIPLPEVHSVGGVLVHMPHVCSIMTATVETVSEQLDLTAIIPTEKVVSAVARAITLSDTDALPNTPDVAKNQTQNDMEQTVEVGPDDNLENFWQTSLGKFKFVVTDLPEQLQFIYELLMEIPKVQKPDILYYMLQCLKILCLHGDTCTKASKEQRGFFIWCQENLLIKNLWNLCNSEHSHICQEAVPLLLHCITLPAGSDVFWRVVQEEFHNTDWKIRFTAVDRVTIIACFMDSTPLRNVPALQAALTNAFCYLISSMDDSNVYVAQRAALYLGTIHDGAIKSLLMCLETQFDSVIVDRPMVLQSLYQLHNSLCERRILNWEFFLNRFDTLFLEAQINLEKTGDISYLRDLRNSDMNSEFFIRKLHRAQEALSQSEGSGASSNKTLSASFGTKWPYKRTMSAPASIVPRHEIKESKEKIYSRQYSAPILKRKSSRFGLGQFLGTSNSIPDGHVHSFNVVDDQNLIGFLHRVIDFEEADKETMHLLIFLLMQFLSRSDQAYPSDEKGIAKSQAIVLRHLFLLLGCRQNERGIYVPPQRLRTSPAFSAYLSNLPQLLDQNHVMGRLLLSNSLIVLQYAPSPHYLANNIDYQQPTYSLWALEPHCRRNWLMSLVVLLYKYQYSQQPHCVQLNALIRIVLNTLDSQYHHCRRIPATVIMGAPPSRSRDVSQPSLGIDNEHERLMTPPLSPMYSLDGQSGHISLNSKGGKMQVIYAKPSSTTSMETHWEEIIQQPEKKTRRSGDYDVDDSESELLAIPESDVSDSTLQGSGQDSFEETPDETIYTLQKLTKLNVTTKVQDNYEFNGHTIKGSSDKRPTWFIGSEDDSLKHPDGKHWDLDEKSLMLHQKWFSSDNSKNCSKITSLGTSSLQSTLAVVTGVPNLQMSMAKTVTTDSHKQVTSTSIETQHISKPTTTTKYQKTMDSAISDCDDCYKNAILPAPSLERLLPIGANRSPVIKSSPQVIYEDINSRSPDSPLSKMDLIILESPRDSVFSPSIESQLEIPRQERLLPIGQHNREISQLIDKVQQALGISATSTKIDNRKSYEFNIQKDSEQEKPTQTHSPRRLIKQVALESPPNQNGQDTYYKDANLDNKREFMNQKQKTRKAETFTVGIHSLGDPRKLGSWFSPQMSPRLERCDYKPNSFRSGDECITERCSECGMVKEEYSDEEIGLCIVTLGTFIHREPSLAAPMLPEILNIVAKVTTNAMYPWQNESNIHLPGGAVSVAHQFLRCVLHQLAPNGIFTQMFQTQGNETARIQFFKSLTQALTDFNELNPIAPLQFLLEALNSKKVLPVDTLPIILENIACYFDCLPLEASLSSTVTLWSSVLMQLENLYRRILFFLSNLEDIKPLLKIMVSVLKLPSIAQFKGLLEPFSKVLSCAIELHIIQYNYLVDLCYLCNRIFTKERDKLILSRMVVYELVQALKFKVSIPDSNLLILINLILQDAGGSIPINVVLQNSLPLYHETGPVFNTNIGECMRIHLGDVVEFLTDFHTLAKMKSYCKGINVGLNEDTLGGIIKGAIAQYLALEITKGNGRDNRAVTKYFPWLYNASSTQQTSREFIECIGHIRLLSWLLLGSLTHSSLHGIGASQHLCQPIPQEASCQIADHIQVIMAGFAEQPKASVLHMSSLFHVFILCQLWTVYLEQGLNNLLPISETYNIIMNILFDFWGKVTPYILQLVQQSKMLSEIVSLHFLSMLEALLECHSTLVGKLLPLWTPVLSSNHLQLPGHLQVRLQNCRNFPPNAYFEVLPSKSKFHLNNPILLRWLQRLQFKMGQIELQSSTATQFYSL